MKEIAICAVLAQNIKRVRKHIRISQMELAQRCSLSASYIGEIELGRKYPSAKAIGRIAQQLGVRPYQLFMDEEIWQVSEQFEAATHMYLYLKQKIDAVFEEASHHYGNPDKK